MLKAIVAAGLLAASSVYAFAANPNFCADYATAALRQVRAAESNPHCAAGMAGTRWSPDYRVHFNWCLGAPGQTAERERAIRTNFLRSCR